MKFHKTTLKDVYIIELEKIEDKRGFFARSYCKNEFLKNGLIDTLVQCNISFNDRKGTLRGMHFQEEPYSEVKIVRCTMGSIYDVIIDLRVNSPTYCMWESFELTSINRNMLYIPKGFAHGFQTLEDNAEVFYQMSEFYHPDSASGLRWNDPSFNITWPISEPIISEKDQGYPDFSIR